MTDGATPLSTQTCHYCESTDIKLCMKCQRHFCATHTSKISPNFCQDCFAQVTVVIDKYTKTTEEYDEATDQVTTHRSSAKRIRLDGPDWVWYSTAIQLITDAELQTMLEFHRFIVSLVEHVETVRKVKKSQELAKQPTPKSISVSTTTETKKRKVIKQQKSPKEILLASGIKEDNPLFQTLLAQMTQGVDKR